MEQTSINTFDRIEFEGAVEGGMEAMYIGKWEVQDIHNLVIETMEAYEAFDAEGEIIPLEWKTGFVFGAIQEFVVKSLVKEYGDRIRQYLNRH